MKTLSPQYWILIVFVLVNAALSAGSLALPGEIDRNYLLTGGVAGDIETVYDESQPLREFAVNAWTAFSLLAFNEGKPGLVIGQKDWLFTEEEFLTGKHSEVVYERNLGFIQETATTLEAEGVALLIVAVPSKARVYPEMVDRSIGDVYGRFIADLNAREIHVVDGFEALNGAEEAMFLRTDTHWTPAGAKKMAESVGVHARQLNLTGTDVFETAQTGVMVFEGDLVQFLPLTPWFESLAPVSEELPLFETISFTSLDLFSEVALPNTVLVGTSYSANPMWHFEGFLKEALSQDLINVAKEGEGPFKTMQAFLTEARLELPQLNTVIWEIPERYLVNPEYSLASGGV